MRRWRLLAAAGAAALALAAHGEDKPCTGAQPAAADKAIERVVTWGQLYAAWRAHGHCDSALLEDVWTDAILRLAVEWRDVEAFAADMTRDAAYRAFVHRHLTSPAAIDDRASLHSRATMGCPAGLDAFCAELAEVVKPGI